MNRRASAPVIILSVLIIISLAFAGGGFYLFQKEKTRNAELSDKLEEINTKQRITESKFEETKKVLVDLQLKYEEAKNNIDTLNNDLEQEKKARLEAGASIEQLRIDLEQQKGLRADLENKLNLAQSDLKRTQYQLNELTSQKTVLEVKVKELETKTQDIELGKIVINPPEPTTPPAPVKKATPKKAVKAASVKKSATTKAAVVPKAAPAPKGLEAKILVLNKEYSFVVINVGTKNGVKVGQQFAVYHNNKYTGDVKIEKVHESMAAAGFVSGDMKDKVYEGDKVVQKS